MNSTDAIAGAFRRAPRYIALLLIVVLAGVYYFAIWSLAVNLPWFDDYVQFLGTYLRLGEDPSPGQWLSVLLEQPQWNGLIKSDHRLGFARATMVALEGLTGQVDFRTLIMIGNAFVGLLFVALWASSPLARREPAVMLPIAFLAFSLAHWESAIWASAALLYYPAAFFALAAIAAALMVRRSLVPAVAAGGLSTVSQANGLLSYPVISMALWVSGRRRAALLFAVLTACVFALYFSDFSRPKGIPDYASTGQAIARMWLGWVQLQGSAFPDFALPAGIAQLLVWGVLVAKQRWKSSPVLFWFGIWLMASMGAVAFGRSSFSDEFVISQIRYRYYGICFLSVTFLLGMELLEAKRARYTLLAALLIVVSFAYLRQTPVIWGHMKKTMVNGTLGANYYRTEGRTPEPSLWFPPVHEVDRIIGYAESRGLYRVPYRKDYEAARTEAPLAGADRPDLTSAFYFDFVDVGSRSLALAGGAEIGGESTCADAATLIFLDSGTARYYFKPVRYARPEAREFFARPCQGFAAFVKTTELPAGTYRIGVSIVRGGRVVAEGVRAETVVVNRVR